MIKHNTVATSLYILTFRRICVRVLSMGIGIKQGWIDIVIMGLLGAHTHNIVKRKRRETNSILSRKNISN